MKRLPLWAAGVGALVLAATVYVACSGASSREAEPPSGLSPELAGAQSSPQVEAGAPVGEPAGGSPAREAKVVYVGPRDVKAVALTFDTGGPAGHVPEILDILKERGRPATFGITGEWAATNPSLLKRIVAEGHAIINHSWSHRSFTGEDTETEPLTPDQMRDELKRTEEKVQEIAEVSTKPYFRPPYGNYDRLVNRVVREAGYKYNVLWLVDGLGWDGRSPKSVAAVTLANAINGAIFLYHIDTQEYKALEEIIEGLDEREMQTVTIPQLLGHEPMPSPAPTATATPTPSGTSTPAPSIIPLPTVKPAPAPVIAPKPAPAPAPTSTPGSYSILAYDGFESGSADGGSGWLGPWQISGGQFLTSGDAPHSGAWQLELSSGAYVFRSADLSGQAKVHLRFWSRLSRSDASDRALVLVSAGIGLPFRVVREFSAAESDGVYRQYDVDLSAFEMTGGFIVGFHHEMTSATDRWHVDDVELVTAVP